MNLTRIKLFGLKHTLTNNKRGKHVYKSQEAMMCEVVGTKWRF